MRILPFENYELKTSVSLNELYASIDEGCEPLKLSAYLNAKPKPLFGKRIENRFKVYDSFRLKNSFRPIAVGTIYDNGEEISVNITIRISILVIIFVSAWMLFLLVVASTMPIAPSLIPLGMCLLGYFVMLYGFWSDVPKLKNIISNILVEHS